MRRILFGLLLVVLGVLAAALAVQNAPQLPGQVGPDTYLLPNGWRLSPAGRQIEVGDLPLAIVLHPDGKRLLVSNNGAGVQSIDVVDLAEHRVTSKAIVEKTWLGLALSADGTRVYAGGGDSNSILQFSLGEGKIAALDPISLGVPGAVNYPGGLCVKDGKAFVANNLGGSVSAIDLRTGAVTGTVAVGDHPYTCVVAPDGKAVYASVWGGAQVAVIDPDSMAVVRRFVTGDHPNAMQFDSAGKRLFVANANSNNISVIDVGTGKVTESISVALYPNSPAGSTTNALVVSPASPLLFAANADNNDVAVVDISRPGQSKVAGFIPVGWYPTALAVSAEGKTLYVANAKGSRSYPNPQGPQPTISDPQNPQQTRYLFKGTISIIPIPTVQALALFTAQVYSNAAYSREKGLAPAFKGKSVVPKRVGLKSPIKHVIYIIRENRTYDQVLGDMKEGNGDAGLTIFGEEVTPNAHALAREFVLLDNIYADAEVSADGHNWSMAAYATDYVEKTWPSQYSGRRKPYDYEGGEAVVAPSSGYIWDACKRARITYRSYGEWVVNGAQPGESMKAQPGALEGHIDPQYRGFDMAYSDIERARRFLSEVRRYEGEGSMPRFQVVRLPNDHTVGTRPGSLTPRAYVAQNDLALGMIVEGVSRSKFWPTSAIFVIEDDAQNGPDHVDAHRTVALVVSPYARGRKTDSTMYSTSSMLRTMELILGIPPLSQYDAAAAPMVASFGSGADYASYSCLPPRVPLTEVNQPNAPGAFRSMEMNFDDADAAPDIELNEIIWRSIRGGDSQMPAPVRSAFVRPLE